MIIEFTCSTGMRVRVRERRCCFLEREREGFFITERERESEREIAK